MIKKETIENIKKYGMLDALAKELTDASDTIRVIAVDKIQSMLKYSYPQDSNRRKEIERVIPKAIHELRMQLDRIEIFWKEIQSLTIDK